MTQSRRHRSGGFPLGRTLAIVLALHGVAGGFLLFLAKTEAGQEIVKTYNIKLLQPEQPPPPKQEEPKPPPPKVEEQVKVSEPTVAQIPAATAATAPQIGGGDVASAGVNWNGGIFAGGFEGPDGAFHAAVTASFRKYYNEPKESFRPAQLRLVVSGTGQVVSYRLLNSSGSSTNDSAILAAAEHVKSEGVPAPPNGEDRTVTIRFTPY